MTDVYPFADLEAEYIKFSNALIDYAMPKLSGNAFKLLTFIIRKTKGWQKDWDRISYSQMTEGTGIKSRSTLSKVIEELLDEGCIFRKKSNNDTGLDEFEYSLNRSYTLSFPSPKNGLGNIEIPSPEIVLVQKMDYPSPKNGLALVQKMDTQKKEKEIFKESYEKKSNLPDWEGAYIPGIEKRPDKREELKRALVELPLLGDAMDILIERHGERRGRLEKIDQALAVANIVRNENGHFNLDIWRKTGDEMFKNGVKNMSNIQCWEEVYKRGGNYRIDNNSVPETVKPEKKLSPEQIEMVRRLENG